MKMTKLARAAVVATGVAVAGLGLAIPASADEFCAADCFVQLTVVWVGKYQARVNNDHSANGSWIWVYGKDMGSHADYYVLGDSKMRKIYAPKNGANSMTLGAKVLKFRVCGPNGIGGDACTVWRVPNL